MQRLGWLRWVVAGVLVLGALAALTLLATSIDLYGSYRPGSEGAASPVLGAIDREDAAAAALSILSAAALVGSAAMLLTRRHWAWGVAVVGSLAGTAGAAASLSTAATVRWDQLALTGVMVGTGFEGYQAGRSSSVQFVLTDGQELATSDFGVALVMHMAGPAIALLGLVTALVVVVGWGGGQPVWRRTKDASSSTASTASGNAG